MHTLSTKRARRTAGMVATLVALALPQADVAVATHRTGPRATYTGAELAAEGKLINLSEGDGALQVADRVTGLEFVWVAVSGKGTVVKIDTQTGNVVGEYLTSPEGRPRDPSRTTVDKNGNVWVSNRAESGTLAASAETCIRARDGQPEACRVSGPSGSIVHIGLEENGQCEDRNGNGRIDTSRGYSDVLLWSNAGDVDADGGVETAVDECLLHYVRVNSTGTRHLSVDRDNNVWVSGTGDRDFDLVDDQGRIVRHEPSVGCGGYGGLISPDGVIWSARPLLRWKPVADDGTPVPLTGPNYTCYSHDSYGLAIDPSGNVWNTALSGNVVRKFAPGGSLLGSFPHGHTNAQGVVADRNGDIWVAHSLLCSTCNSVGHLRNDGTFVGNVTTSSGPTGVAVDGSGRVWATNYGTQTAARIDPTLNGGIGAVDLESRNLGGVLYNYSDMTGSTLVGAPRRGTMSLVHDAGVPEHDWSYVTYAATVPEGSSLTVEVSSSDDGVSFSPGETLASGVPTGVPDGQYLKVQATLERAPTGETPLLHEIVIGRREATLTASPALIEVDHPGGEPRAGQDVGATLADADSGAALAGREIVFSALDPVDGSRQEICRATTDGEGRATCDQTAGLLPVVLAREYQAEFAGDPAYEPAAASAPLTRVEVDLP